MHTAFIVILSLSAGGLGSTITVSNPPTAASAPSPTRFTPTPDMLDNMNVRVRSLRLTGPNDARSSSGWLLFQGVGGRICFDVDTALLPRCDRRIYFDGVFIRTDSPFFAVYLSGYWLRLPVRDPDLCNGGAVGTIITHQPTGARTRACLCTSDGAATPTYAWQNLATGTVGTSTTCDL